MVAAPPTEGALDILPPGDWTKVTLTASDIVEATAGLKYKEQKIREIYFSHKKKSICKKVQNVEFSL